MNSGHRPNLSQSREEPQPALEQDNGVKLEAEMKWALRTVYASSWAYAAYFGIMVPAFSFNVLFSASVVPLVVYELGKAIICGCALYRKWRALDKEDVKDMLESLFLVLFYVRAISGRVGGSDDENHDSSGGLHVLTGSGISEHHHADRCGHGNLQ
jgi:hypothetical protein